MLLGGTKITGAEWISTRALRVRFTSALGTAFHYQLYAGRSLVGQTLSTSDRSLIAAVIPSAWPQHLQLVAVAPAERFIDFGSLLPPRPYNRLQLAFSLDNYAAAGAAFYEITAGTEAGGSVDPNNVLLRQPFDFNGAHTYSTPPLTGSGTWNFAVRGRDGTLPSGNGGTVLAIAGTVLSHPPDVTPQADGRRFQASTDGGELTVTFDV